MNNTIKILGGILLGAALGTAAGLLIAPTSGKKTLKTLGKKSKGYKKQIGAAVASYLDDAKNAYNRKVDAYAKNGKTSIDTVKDSVKI
jgi:gas vesicle protein